MSKWFSAPCNAGRALALAASLALIACQAPATGNAAGAGVGASKNATSADLNVDPVATSEPGHIPRRWRARNQFAQELTGNLSGASLESGRGTPLTLSFAEGIQLKLEQVGFFHGRDPSFAGGRSFADVLASHSDAQVYVYRVTGETLAPIARGRGMCTPRRTTFLAVSEYVDEADRWIMSIAAYGGELSPSPGGPDASLCAVFVYWAPPA